MVALSFLAAAAETVVPSERVRSSVFVRRDLIARRSPVLGALKSDDRALLLESVSSFYRVRLANGAEGYVAKSWTRCTGVGSAALGSARRRRS